MVALSLLVTWLLAATIATCFNFTAPTPGTALNLSASSINIEWSSENEHCARVDLGFKAQSSEGTVFGYTIAQDISVEGGQYTWNPSNVSDALENTEAELTDSTDYRFQAFLHDINSSSGASLDSEAYEVTGHQYTGTAAKTQIGVKLCMVASLIVAFATL